MSNNLKYSLPLLATTLFTLSGCNLLPKPVEEVTQTNRQVTIDIQYLNPTSTQDALSKIEGFYERVPVGQHMVFDKADPQVSYYVVRGIQYDAKTNSINLTSLTTRPLSGGSSAIDMANGARIQFTEPKRGVYESSSVSEYFYGRTVVGTEGELMISPEYKHYDQLKYSVDRALEDLGKTYSMMDLEVKSEYSPEATKATLQREFNAKMRDGFYYSNLDLDNIELPMKLKVSPYKNGSIITGKVGVPVRVDEGAYIYGERLDDVTKQVKLALNR